LEWWTEHVHYIVLTWSNVPWLCKVAIYIVIYWLRLSKGTRMLFLIYTFLSDNKYIYIHMYKNEVIYLFPPACIITELLKILQLLVMWIWTVNTTRKGISSWRRQK
jgi:hypothetical protein